MEELEKFYPVMKFAEEPLDQVYDSQFMTSIFTAKFKISI